MASPAHLFVLGLVLSVITGSLCYDLMPKPKECKNKIGDKKCEDLFNNKYNGKTYDMCFSYNGFDDCCAFCVDRLVCVNGNQNDLSDLKVKYMYLTVECKDTMKYSQCQNIYDNVYKKDTKAMCEDKKYSKMCCTFCRSGVGKAWNNRLIDEWIKHPYSAVDYFLGGKNDYNGYDKNGYYENKDKSYGYDDYDGKADDYIKNMFGVFGYDDKDDYGYDYKGEYDNSKGDKGYDEHTETVFDFVKNMLDDIGLDGKGDYDDKIYGYDDKNDQGSYKSKGYRGYDDKDGNLDLNNLLDGYNSGETYGKDSDYTKGLLNDLGFGNLNNLIGDDYDLDKLVGNILKGSGYDDKKDYLRGTLSSRNTRKASSRRRREAEGDGVCKDTIGKDNCRKMMMNKYTVHGGMPHIFCANPHNMVSCCRFCSSALADGEENRKRRSLAFQDKSEYPADGESEPCDGDSLGPRECNQIVYSMFEGSKAAMCSTVHYGNVCCQSCRRYATLRA